MDFTTSNCFADKPITTLTFDCYGTLVDWERGACTALRKLLPLLPTHITDDELIRSFLAADTQLIESGVMPYAHVLKDAVKTVAALFVHSLDNDAADFFAASLPSWPVFAETNPTLIQLSRRYRLAIISNIDDYLIAETLKNLSVHFDVITTSERANCYKPARGIFVQALKELGEPNDRIIHVAEGLCEARPARELGMGSIWVKRSARSDDGSGAVPDAQVGNLTELIQLLRSEG